MVFPGSNFYEVGLKKSEGKQDFEIRCISEIGYFFLNDSPFQLLSVIKFFQVPKNIFLPENRHFDQSI